MKIKPMKKYTLNTRPLNQFPVIERELKKNPEQKLLFHFGIDVELVAVALSVIINGGKPRYLNKHTRKDFLKLVAELISLGHEIHCVQEACGFGPYLHRDLLAQGAGSIIAAPKKLDDKRKTDKADANALAQLLWDYEHNGDKSRFKIVRDLGEPARQRRAISRQHEQLQKSRQILAGNARSLMHEHGFFEVPLQWWGSVTWKKFKIIIEQHAPWLLEMIEPLQQLIQNIHQRILNLNRDVQENRLDQPIAKGLGTFTYAVIENEVGDWTRFNNRRQVSSYTGFCPRENSSGSHQRLGAIDRRGNRRIRKQLVEAVWRLQMWNSEWRGFKKFPHVFGKDAKVSGATRKKAVVACARLLMVDLWRLSTRQTTLEKLGLIPAESVTS